MPRNARGRAFARPRCALHPAPTFLFGTLRACSRSVARALSVAAVRPALAAPVPASLLLCSVLLSGSLPSSPPPAPRHRQYSRRWRSRRTLNTLWPPTLSSPINATGHRRHRRRRRPRRPRHLRHRHQHRPRRRRRRPRCPAVVSVTATFFVIVRNATQPSSIVHAQRHSPSSSSLLLPTPSCHRASLPLANGRLSRYSLLQRL